MSKVDLITIQNDIEPTKQKSYYHVKIILYIYIFDLNTSYIKLGM